MQLLNVPLHIVNLKSDFVNGPVTVGVMHSLPVSGVHLLLGNDFAGDKVVVNPLVTANPSLDQIDPIEIKILSCTQVVQLPELWQ